LLRDVGGVGGGGGADYVMLSEDDALMCGGHLGDVSKAIVAARAVDPAWSMLRTSIGFIGIVIPRADASALGDFLEAYYQSKPPDILLIEWVHGGWPGSVRATAAAAQDGQPRVGENQNLSKGGQVGQGGGAPPPRMHFVATRNGFEHIGAVSSLRRTGLSHTPACGAALTSFLWAMERFGKTARCAEIGIVPCDRVAY
jgi:hypothetical protein